MFPSDRPLPAGEGDDQALAVNTEDGAVEYAVSFSLVWADGDTAANRNEAYALASCIGCRTVAVAVQVVLLLGDVDVVVPETLSAAVTYACIQCVTYALATQLVVSVPGELDEQALRDLAAVWERLRAFGEQIEGVPLSELQARLTEFEQQILAIVQRGRQDAPASAERTPSPASVGAASDESGTATEGADGPAAPTGEEAATTPPSTPASSTGMSAGMSARTETTDPATATTTSSSETVPAGEPSVTTTPSPSG